MIPGTSMTRFTIVMLAMMAAIVGVALAFADSRPLLALGLTVVICIISSAVLPSATWVRFTDFCRRAFRKVTRREHAPGGPVRVTRAGLDEAEYDARIQIGMPLRHLERLAYNLEGPLLALDRSVRDRNAEQWDELEAGPDLWPGGEWVDVIEDVRREQGWSK